MYTPISSVYVKKDLRILFSGFGPPGKFERIRENISDILSRDSSHQIYDYFKSVWRVGSLKALRKESLLPTRMSYFILSK